MNETAQKILGFINRLPETWDGQPLRQHALDNFFKHPILFEADVDIQSFISLAFSWSETYEGAKYWSDISKKIEDSTIQLLPDGEEKKEEKKDGFVWDDNLVMEFALQTKVNGTKDWVCSQIEQFKASKQRKCLFTTEDRVNIYHGDTYWYVEVDNNFDITRTTACSSEQQIPECKDFSTEAAAREYVRLNKPMYSVNDVEIAAEMQDWAQIDTQKLITELEKLKQ